MKLRWAVLRSKTMATQQEFGVVFLIGCLTPAKRADQTPSTTKHTTLVFSRVNQLKPSYLLIGNSFALRRAAFSRRSYPFQQLQVGLDNYWDFLRHNLVCQLEIPWSSHYESLWARFLWSLFVSKRITFLGKIPHARAFRFPLRAKFLALE